jgi:hypothetical protein
VAHWQSVGSRWLCHYCLGKHCSGSWIQFSQANAWRYFAGVSLLLWLATASLWIWTMAFIPKMETTQCYHPNLLDR